METTDVQSDMGIGLTVLFGVLTAMAAAWMVVAGDQFTTAVGFAVAVVAACLAVVSSHLY